MLKLDEILDQKSAFMACKITESNNSNISQGAEDTNAI